MSISEEEKKIEHITKMSLRIQANKIKTFSKIDTNHKLNVFEEQKVIFHKLKQSNKDKKNSLLTLCSLLLAIETVIDDEIAKVENIKTYRKKSTKREKLLNVWAVVTKLKRKEELSFREISRYLKKYHKLEIAHSTIFEIWNEIEGDNNESNK